MSRFINPFTDWGFKQIFGQEMPKVLLIDFLNDLLVGERVIRDLQFLNNEQSPDYQEGKGIIYDIFCTTDTGERIIVEMQGSPQTHFRERALYYMSRAIARQGLRGDEGDYNINAVYGVFFMNFQLPEEEHRKMRIDVILADRESGKLFSDKLRPIFITLPLFTKEENECCSDFERWMYVLKNMKALDRMPFKARKAVFEKLEEIADVGALSPEERDKYENSLRVYNDYLSTMKAAEQKGEAIGEARGEARGEAKGEAKAQLRIASEMKAKGMDVVLISELTKLPIDIIKGL